MVVNVNVAVRAGPVWPVAHAYTDVSPDPVVLGDVVSHDSSEDVTAHAPEAFSCMNTPVPALVGMSHVVRSSVNVGAAPEPGWVTDTVRVTAGEPDVVVNVIVADRDVVVVFAAAFRVTDPLPLPVAGEIVTHVAFELALHVTFDVTVTGDDADDADGTDHDEVLSVNAGVTAAPGCVTDTVRVTAGVPDVVVNVMVAVRDAVVVFAAADRVTDPSPLPVVGDTVAHVWFDDTDHEVFEDTCAATCAALADGTVHEEIPIVNVGVTAAPGCVTDTVRVTAGDPDVVVNVIVADRDVVVVFADAFRVTDPLPLPVAGDTVTHV